MIRTKLGRTDLHIHIQIIMEILLLVFEDKHVYIINTQIGNHRNSQDREKCVPSIRHVQLTCLRKPLRRM